MEITNQKEYLKKYLSGSVKEGKKKKKRKPILGNSVTIIDDDIDISQLQTAEEAIDLFTTKEDAPQVVGVIDERPMHLRVKDYCDSNLWKPVGEQANISFVEKDVAKTSFQIKLLNKSDSILPFKQVGAQKNIKSASIRKNLENTLHTENGRNHKLSSKSIQKSSETNLSDQSPPRKNQKTPDNSPPRRRQKDSSPSCKIQKSTDSSPPRRSLKYSDNSPPRRINSEKRQRFQSSIRISDDSSPVRRNNRDSSPSRKNPETSKAKRKMLPGDKRGKYLIPAKRNDRMTKTLDGKTAGLQNAQELVTEIQEFRKREDDLFKRMDADVSGINAATIIRDRKTGRIRDFAKEVEERKEKEKREEETKEKYMQWGMGLKQVEDYQDKLVQDLHEMNKPLARYADDEDLEKYLKEREREEDPMLQYIRRKKKKKEVDAGVPSKPQYMGEFMPNRYGIVPGHRWDGVDRSNGYEQRWLEAQNAKLAIQEDIYKWSTEDM